MSPAKSTSAATDATVPCNQSLKLKDSVEPVTEKSACSAGEPATEMKSGDSTDAAAMAKPPSLASLAAQCVSTGVEKRRVWADAPMEPVAPAVSSGPCYELDPTPQEAAAAAAAATSQKPTSSDSGGEDSAKENRETVAYKSDNGKGAKKKGLKLILHSPVYNSCEIHNDL